MRRTIPPLPPYAFMACKGTAVLVLFIFLLPLRIAECNRNEALTNFKRAFIKLHIWTCCNVADRGLYKAACHKRDHLTQVVGIDGFTWLEKEEVVLKIPWFYFLGEHQSGIHGTVVHMDTVQSSTETTPPEILYRVWVYAVGSNGRCISRITRDAHVEL